MSEAPANESVNQQVARLAPSPTGAQHLGNARTFLLAFWSARSIGARIVLRIEDIDSPRVKPWAAQQAIDDLRWLEIGWEGEPFIQTDNADRYDEVIDGLVQRDLVYPCICSRRDIERASSAPHEVQPESVFNDRNVRPSLIADTTVYPGTCSTWRHGDAIPPAGSFCWRLRTKNHHESFDDLVAGPLSIDVGETLGDFPITRKAGPAAYQLAVVVDDINAGITEVVRGDDLVVSTFRQLLLYRLLNASPPRYAHVPLVVGTDGRRLAKRHGDTRLSQYRDRGIPADQVIAWAAATSGLISKNDAVLACRDWSVDRWHDEMTQQFSWKHISRERAVVDAIHWPEHAN